MKWVPGGKEGTRAWKRVGVAYKIQPGRSSGKVKSFFKELQSTCKHKTDSGLCIYKENLNNACNVDVCPLIIRR
jgi:hypothetical protein